MDAVNIAARFYHKHMVENLYTQKCTWVLGMGHHSEPGYVSQVPEIFPELGGRAVKTGTVIFCRGAPEAVSFLNRWWMRLDIRVSIKKEFKKVNNT